MTSYRREVTDENSEVKNRSILLNKVKAYIHIQINLSHNQLGYDVRLGEIYLFRDRNEKGVGTIIFWSGNSAESA